MKKKSLRLQIIAIETTILFFAFLTLCLVSNSILKGQIENQWKEKDSVLVDAYSDWIAEKITNGSGIEDIQVLIDDINKNGGYNYVVYMADVDGKVTALAHSNHDRIGIELTDDGSVAAARDGKEYVGYFKDKVSGKKTLDILSPVYDKSGTLKGAMNIGV